MRTSRKDIRIGGLISKVQNVSVAMQRLHFAKFHPPPGHWQPAMDAFVCEDRIELCFDVAGVSLDELRVEVGERRLVVSGNRRAPEHSIREGDLTCRGILALEIESGPFRRALDLPADVDPDRINVDYRDGLLWIRLAIGQS